MLDNYKKRKTAAVNQLFAWSLVALLWHAIRASNGNRKVAPSTTAVSVAIERTTANWKEKPKILHGSNYNKKENMKVIAFFHFPLLHFSFLPPIPNSIT